MNHESAYPGMAASDRRRRGYSRAIICVQNQVLLTKAPLLQKEVEIANHSVRALRYGSGLINQEIHLLV